MSMFRSPSTDDPTPDAASSSDEDDVFGYSCEESQLPLMPGRDAMAPRRTSPQWEDIASESVPGSDDPWDSTGWLPNTAEQHATLLTSSLLEFAYNVKAAEYLNHAQGTTRFHRESPEARALGATMYQGASTVLASNGIIADCVHKELWKEMRQQYIMGVENLGLQALEESMSPQAKSPRRKLSPQDTNMLIDRTSRCRYLDILGSNHLPTQFVPIEQHRQMVITTIRSLAVPSPHTDMQLWPTSSFTSGNRYKTEFWELKRIGKGGFGTVFHVKNFVDNQEYAIKKIPLDSKRLQKWQTSGAKEVKALLKEIRTLARLEHSNVVRYYGAWIEGADGTIDAAGPSKISHQLYLNEEPASCNGSDRSSPQLQELPNHKSMSEGSVDATIKNDTSQCTASLPDAAGDDFARVVFGEDSDAPSNNHDVVPRPEQILSQGHNAQQLNYDRTSSDTSLSNETDVFTDGAGEVRSSDLKRQNVSAQPLMTLHIQMSLHPLCLSTYLAYSSAELRPIHSRHCFHLLPSLRLIRAILSGVQHLHSQGIIHRDLKPGNIFLSEHLEYDQGPGCVDITCHDCRPPPKLKRYLNPRIGDFGLVADISGVKDDTTTSVDTSSSNFASKAVGTEFYRPPLPQQDRSSQAAIDEKIDVFALGILLFELLWKMNTKMERHMLLSDLSKKGILPEGFARKIDPSGRPWRQEEEGEGQAEGGFATVGECVGQCIRNMVHRSSTKRWRCASVRKRLDDLIGMLE